jgi:hypothetical protein
VFRNYKKVYPQYIIFIEAKRKTPTWHKMKAPG